MGKATTVPPLATDRVLLYLAAQDQHCATRRALLAEVVVAVHGDEIGVLVACAGLTAAGYLDEIGRRDDPGWQLTPNGYAWAADISERAS